MQQARHYACIMQGATTRMDMCSMNKLCIEGQTLIATSVASVGNTTSQANTDEMAHTKMSTTVLSGILGQHHKSRMLEMTNDNISHAISDVLNHDRLTGITVALAGACSCNTDCGVMMTNILLPCGCPGTRAVSKVQCIQ